MRQKWNEMKLDGMRGIRRKIIIYGCGRNYEIERKQRERKKERKKKNDNRLDSSKRE